MMKSTEFVAMAKKIATDYKTLYVMGCFGSPMTAKNKQRFTQNHSYNKKSNRTKIIKAASASTFGFDCVCLVKSILWGWNGNSKNTYGGAVYKSNNVPDVSADDMMQYCTDVTTDFKNIQVGEILHMSGHVGIYIGDGLAVECTPIWKDGVQITAVGNLGNKSGYNTRTWVNHGKSKFIDYVVEKDSLDNYTDEQLADMAMKGVFGSGSERKTKLGNRYEAVQKIINQKTSSAVNNQKVYHKVVKGDTLSKIAKKYNTSVSNIMKLNSSIKNANMICLGQLIRVK